MTGAALPVGALLAGVAAGVMQLAGGVKTAPGLAPLPFDLTLGAALLLAPLLASVAATRRWAVSPALGPPIAAAALLMLWLVVAASWSASRAVAAAKLGDVVLVGPAMLGAGLLLGAEPAARRALAAVSLGAGVALAAAFLHAGWNGGLLRMALEEGAKANYQVAGLGMAIAAGLAAVRAVEARGIAGVLFWAGVVALLAAGALLPGGRAALLGLGLAVAVAPVLRLRDRPRAALAWLAAAALAGGGAAALLLAVPSEGLRTLERLTSDVGSLQARIGLWEAALDQAGQAAPLGLGTGGFSIAAGHGERRGLYPHNAALEALAEAGLPGLLLWLGAFGGGAVAFLSLLRGADPARAARIAAMTLPVAVSATVSGDLGNRMAWFALGLALSLGVTATAARPTAPRHV